MIALPLTLRHRPLEPPFHSALHQLACRLREFSTSSWHHGESPLIIGQPCDWDLCRRAIVLSHPMLAPWGYIGLKLDRHVTRKSNVKSA